MAIRTTLLNWNIINRDSDFSKYIEAISDSWWVVKWLEVSLSSLSAWQCFVPCLRSNGETIFVLVSINANETISWEWDVYIEVKQEYIDNGELANEDWTGVAEIKVWTLPENNALLLATISEWEVEDKRFVIPKMEEISAQLEILWLATEDLDERVEKLETGGAIDHLEETWLVWELYTLNDTLFKQYTPTLTDSTLDCNVWDTANNTEIHIQRQWSGVASNQLKLKVKSVWSPTTWLVVEVRKGVQVTVTENVEAYWYWDENEIIATWSIAYSDITNTYAEFTITLDNEFWWTEWELLDIVVYQTWSIVNASDYYSIACDRTQYSEAFSYVSVNGSTRTRSKLMPYGISDGFAQSLLCNAEYFWPFSWWSDSESIETIMTDATVNQKYYVDFDIVELTNSAYKTFRLEDSNYPNVSLWVSFSPNNTWHYSGIITTTGNNIAVRTRWCYYKNLMIRRKDFIMNYQDDTEKTTKSTSYVNILSYTIPISWKIKVSYQIKAWSSSYGMSCVVNISWTDKYSDAMITSTTYSLKTHTDDTIYSAWTQVIIQLKSGYQNASAYIKDISIETYNDLKPFFPVEPLELKTIWKNIRIYTFWNKDWTFKRWAMIDKDTSATTWEITLWNAVWYIKVRYDWEYIKIPYYSN